jgi:hypothetical protein
LDYTVRPRFANIHYLIRVTSQSITLRSTR